MALETGTYISDLNVSNPANTDGVTQADDHLRLIKSTVKATFPNITGAVTPTQADLNKLTSAGNPQFSTIELGAASDTTLSRVSAGVIAVEGVTVPLNSITNTHTAQQIELGHASDTTITRSAAGVLAVEGGVIPKENRANTFTADQTINGAVVGLFLNSNTDYTPQINLTHSGATAGSGPYLVVNRARGTYSSPSIVSSGDIGGTIAFQAHDGTTYRGLAGISAYVDGTPGSSDMPGRLSLLTTPDGSATPTERMRIDSSGNVGIGVTPSVKFDTVGPTWVRGAAAAGAVAVITPDATSGSNGIAIEASFLTGGNGPIKFKTAATDRLQIDTLGNVLNVSSGGLGYGTGSGGTIAQAGSRTTGVTINKTNGSITLLNAPNSTAYRTFTVTNSTVAATDVILLSQRSGVDRQQLLVTFVGAGSFDIAHATVSGTTTEAPIINFAVIKAVTS